MASGKLLRQLIKSGVQGDEEAFRAASEEVIRQERQKQHHLLANDLERILYGESNRPMDQGVRRLAESVPVDKERGLPLVEIVQPVKRLDEIVMTPENDAVVGSILEEYRREDLLRSFGLKPSRKLLFFGPPGCGKTVTSEAIAEELCWPLAIVRLDGVVSSFLGETARNLRAVFDFLSSSPMVVLFDEFDALAKERSGGSDHGEMHRVVNAFLQLFDAYKGRSLLIAATNHEQLLDRALWRRFDEVLSFQLPSDEALTRFLESKLRGVRREFEPDDNEIIALLRGKSFGVVERILRRAIKDMVLRNEEFLTATHTKRAASREVALVHSDS